MRRHRRRVDRPRDGAGDDDRTFFGHEHSPFLLLARSLIWNMTRTVSGHGCYRAESSEVLDVAIHTDGLTRDIAGGGRA